MRAYEPELKRQSAEWRREGSPRRQKFRHNPSPVKLMVILAYDVQEVILCNFVPHDESVNAQYYAAYLQNHLCRAVKRKWPQLQNMIILHDNATPHKAICVRDLLILQPFRHITYVTTHSPTLPSLYLRHSSFSNPSFASLTSQALHLIHLASRP